MYRLSITEYGLSKVSIPELANNIGLQEEELKEMLIEKGKELKELLMLKQSPMQITDNFFSVVEIAGIISLNNIFFIEVAPKFLGNDELNGYWREDFFFLAMLSRYGKILESDKITAAIEEENSFYMLLAKIMIEMYEKNAHKPIRNYHKRIFKDFSIDAEFEAEDIILPDADGFEQYEFILGKQNRYNTIISQAFNQLASQINDYHLKFKINKILNNLSTNDLIISKNASKFIPNRNSEWQDLYNLSLQIIDGSGLTLKTGELNSFGYVINTWRVWEDVISIALSNVYGHKLVKTQKSYTLGVKEIINDGVRSISRVKVIPDIVVYEEIGDKPYFILDAKYKGNVDKARHGITKADLYEALAFAKAVNCNNVFLAYPSSPNRENHLGHIEVFEIIKQGLIKIIGIKINIKGISKINALSDFMWEIRNCLEDILSYEKMI